MSLALTKSALSARIWLSSAAGMRMSQSKASNASLLIAVDPGVPTTVLCLFLWASTFSGSRPLSELMPPPESLTATMRAPASWNSRAALLPALPYPCTATRTPSSVSMPGMTPRVSSCWVAYMLPLAVASSRPTEPPSSSGLPVTTARLFCPGCIMSNVS